MADDLFYKLILFKIKGHRTWRVTNYNDFQKSILKTAQVTHAKMIQIDRLSGDIKLLAPDQAGIL